LTKKHRCKI